MRFRAMCDFAVRDAPSYLALPIGRVIHEDEIIEGTEEIHEDERLSAVFPCIKLADGSGYVYRPVFEPVKEGAE